MAVEPSADLGVFVVGIIVADDIDNLVGWHAGIDGIEEADQLLDSRCCCMLRPTTVPSRMLNAGNSVMMPFEFTQESRVVMGHRAEPPFLEPQSGPCAAERLNLARQHDGVGWRRDVMPDQMIKLVGKLKVVRLLERPEA